jgi:hypothetical protein
MLNRYLIDYARQKAAAERKDDKRLDKGLDNVEETLVPSSPVTLKKAGGLDRSLLKQAMSNAQTETVAGQVKQAIPAWGGGSVRAQSRFGPGVEAGYTHAMGLVPVPYAGLRLGGRNFGVSAGLPYFGIDYGREPGVRGEWNYPESIWSHLFGSRPGAEEPEEDAPASQDSKRRPKKEQKAEQKSEQPATQPAKNESWRKADRPALKF